MHFRAIHSPKFANLLTLVMSFDDALTRANFSFVNFLQFYLLKFFLTFFNGGLNPPTPLWLRHWHTAARRLVSSLHCVNDCIDDEDDDEIQLVGVASQYALTVAYVFIL